MTPTPTALLVTGGAALLLLAGCASTPSVDTSPAIGDTPPPTAALYTMQDLQSAILTDDDLDAVGLSTVGVPKPGGQSPSPLSVEYPKNPNAGYTPECSIISSGRLITPMEFASTPNDPATVVLPDPGADYNSDRDKQITVTGRVFPSTEAATQFLVEERAAVAACPSWNDSSSGDEYPVTATQLNSAGDSVAWTTDFGSYQELIAYLRAGNLIVAVDQHNNLPSDTKSAIIDAQVNKLNQVAPAE